MDEDDNEDGERGVTDLEVESLEFVVIDTGDVDLEKGDGDEGNVADFFDEDDDNDEDEDEDDVDQPEVMYRISEIREVGGEGEEGRIESESEENILVGSILDKKIVG